MRSAIVVGGGIGGLCAATLLARQGLRVRLLERAPRIEEVGAGLQLSPNGLAVIRAMGLVPQIEARDAVAARAVVLHDYRAGRQVARLDLARLAAAQSYLFVHRADLVAVLLDAARAAGVTIDLGARVGAVHPGAFPSVVLVDGTTHRAEVVIAADGIHSTARRVLNGADKAKFSGQVAWRALVPNLHDHPPQARVTMGPGRHLVSYPLRGGRLVNLVAVEERAGWAAEGWQHADDPDHLRAAFAMFGGPAEKLLAEVRQTTLWGLHRHPVAGCWLRDGVVLLGDAAHPTLPFLAQGANLALEDAWVLAQAIQAEDLPRYPSRRIARVRRVIRAAERNAWRYHLRNPLLRLGAHSALTLGSRLAPGRMVGAFDWLYGHDVTDGSPR